MAQAKLNIANGLTIVNSETGETIAMTVETLEVSNAVFENLKNDPTSITNVNVVFDRDNNGSLYARLDIVLLD